MPQIARPKFVPRDRALLKATSTAAIRDHRYNSCALMSTKAHSLSHLKIDGESLSIGMINPRLPAALKAAAYIDLLLAPPDEAHIYGEPSAILQEYFAKSEIAEFRRVDKEIIAATLGLMQIMSSGTDGLAVVGDAIANRPEVLSTVAAWLAYTPHLDDGQEPANFNSASGLDMRNPEATNVLPLTPEQTSVQYNKAVIGSVSLLLCAGNGKGALRKCVRKHLVGSKHFRNAMLRLVALIGRWDPTAGLTGSAQKQDEAKSAMQSALIARDAVCAIAQAHRAGLDFVDEATHPFLRASARSLVEAIRVQSPLQLPAEGARHPDDPFTARDYLQTSATLVVVLLLGRYAAWPLLKWSCLTVLALPGRVLRWVIGASTTVA